MSNERIGTAHKNPEGLSTEEGVSFEIPYGEDKYGITLSDDELDLLLDQGYEEAMGRRSRIGSSCTIELDSPDLPLFAHASSIRIENEPSYPPRISLAIGIVTMSHVNEHRGILTVRRELRLDEGSWESTGYQTQPPLRDIEDIAAYTT